MTVEYTKSASEAATVRADADAVLRVLVVAEQRWRNYRGPGLRIEEIATSLGLGRARIQAALTQLIMRGRVRVRGSGSWYMSNVDALTETAILADAGES
jgi:DNA-binding GntR family transcriptional regulator